MTYFAAGIAPTLRNTRDVRVGIETGSLRDISDQRLFDAVEVVLSMQNKHVDGGYVLIVVVGFMISLFCFASLLYCGRLTQTSQPPLALTLLRCAVASLLF